MSIASKYRSIALIVLIALVAMVPLAQAEDAAPQASEQAAPEIPAADDDADVQTPEIENDEAPTPVRVERVDISMKNARLFPGESAKADAQVSPKNATEPTVEWSSSEPDVVKVGKKGKITVSENAHVPAEGLFVDIWAKAKDGSLAMNCVTVQVLPTLKRLAFLMDEFTVPARKDKRTASLPVEISPASLSGVLPVTWSSSDPKVVSVKAGGAAGEVGLITWGSRAGKAVITAKAAGGQAHEDSLTVIVENVAATLRISGPDTLEKGGEATLSASIEDFRGGKLSGVPVSWSLSSPVPGVTVSEKGRLTIDRYCSADSAVVSCKALDGGEAEAFKTLRIVGQTPYLRIKP